MILVTDIGNTNIKLGVFRGDTVVFSGRLSSSTHKTADEYHTAVADLFRHHGVSMKDITGSIMSSVNPNINYTFEHLIRASFGIKPLIVGSGIKTGIKILYDNPKEVGADRIVNSVAAYTLYGGPCIVLDCGTATTLNAISEKGEFLGGAISFGLKTAADALNKKAAKLPIVELTAPKSVIGKTTISNMQSGLIFGFTGMVKYMIEQMKAEMGGNPRVIATGGLSEIVKTQSACIDTVDRALSLKGLNIIYKLNQGGKES